MSTPFVDALPSRRPRGERRALSLVELLMVIAVIAVLVAVIFPAVGLLRTQAKLTGERSATRQALTAWTAYATDHRGRVLPGYKVGLPAFTGDGVPLADQSNPVTSARWPWRLAPYFDGNLAILYQGDHASVMRTLEGLPDGDTLYLGATYPSIGLNSTFVGGDETEGGFNRAFRSAFGAFYVDRLSAVREADRLIVFTSARAENEIPDAPTRLVEGFFRVKSPAFSDRRWAEAYDEDDPASFGNVSLRWDGRAVTGQADGSVETLDAEGIDDMRRWSNQADAVDWTLSPL